MLRLRSKIALRARSSAGKSKLAPASAPGSVLRPCTFSTESPKAINMLMLFPKEFPKALNTIIA